MGTLSRSALFPLVVVVRSLASQRTLLCRHDAGMLGVLVRDKVLQHFQAQGICIHMVLIWLVTVPSPSFISPQKVAQVQVISRVGLVGVVTGEVIRKTAMVGIACLNSDYNSTSIPMNPLSFHTSYAGHC